MFRVRIVNVRYKYPTQLDMALQDFRAAVWAMENCRLACRIVAGE